MPRRPLPSALVHGAKLAVSREHSRAGLARKLKQKGHETAEVESALDSLQEKGFIKRVRRFDCGFQNARLNAASIGQLKGIVHAPQKKEVSGCCVLANNIPGCRPAVRRKERKAKFGAPFADTGIGAAKPQLAACRLDAYVTAHRCSQITGAGPLARIAERDSG